MPSVQFVYLYGRSKSTVAPAVEASAESLAAWKYDLSPADDVLLEKVQRGCFQYFWQEVGTPALLAKDKTSDTVCSIAAVGFQLSSLPIAVERGWISRAEGQHRTLTVLRSLVDRRDNKKFGIYFHYLDERTGGLPDYTRTKHRYELQASTVDHALFQSGAMTAASYFGGDVEKLADYICNNANWQAVYDRRERLDHDGLASFDGARPRWSGGNSALILGVVQRRGAADLFPCGRGADGGAHGRAGGLLPAAATDQAASRPASVRGLLERVLVHLLF